MLISKLNEVLPDKIYKEEYLSSKHQLHILITHAFTPSNMVDF